MDIKANVGELEWINPKDINPSDDNPRSKDFYKDRDFIRLRESVTRYGVIVPVIVKKYTKGNKYEYKLIDGERRWKASIESNQPRIPAYIFPPHEKIDILTTMFQIHMNQEGWKAIEQAQALEGIIETLKKVNPDEKRITEELIKRTGMDSSTAKSRVRFFKWPEDIRKMAYRKTDKDYYSYIVEVESNIIEPALKNFPDIEETISAENIRRALFEKITSGYVSRANEPRDAIILAKPRKDKKEFKQAKNLLVDFIKDKSFSFAEAKEQYYILFTNFFILKRILLLKKAHNAFIPYYIACEFQQLVGISS